MMPYNPEPLTTRKVSARQAREKAARRRFGLIQVRSRLPANLPVMNSPKLKEEDVLAYATNRSLSDEVVNQISLKREWLQNYKVKLALIRNPKTHQTVSLKLLTHILEKDLRNIAKDKNVHPIVSRQALRELDKKGKL